MTAAKREGGHTPGPWVLYIEQRPPSKGVYEWRVPSTAVPGMVLIVAAHMRERGAGGSTVVSPVFDYWDGYQLHVPSGIEWRSSEDHSEVERHAVKIVSIEGLSLCECIYCGTKPTFEAHESHRGGGVTIGPKPWDLNSWRFVCCAWGRTPTLSDPREIERIRRTAIARATVAALIAERDAYRAVLREFQDGRRISNPHTQQVARDIEQQALARAEAGSHD